MPIDQGVRGVGPSAGALVLLASASTCIHRADTHEMAKAPAGDDGSSGGAGGPHWVGTWASGPQLVETANLPPAPGLFGNTLRQVVYVSIGGNQLRVRLSNAYGDGPVTMTSVHLAASRGGSEIDAATDRPLTFSGSLSVTIQPGAAVFSDPFAYALHSLTPTAITMAFGTVPSAVTGHPGSRTTSYLVAGNVAAAQSLPSAATAAHWYYITAIDVMADASSAALVVLGDSITDGRGSTTDGNNRWPDDLSRRLQTGAPTGGVAVLNEGIGGNAVLSGGLGPTAVQRFTNDVLNQSGARWLVLLEGVNDIGASRSQDVATTLIAAFGQLVDRAHGKGMRVYGVPILPFGTSMYAGIGHEASRQTVNHWIRTSGLFDAVIDLDAAVCDPAQPANLLPAYDSGDGLHLNPAGYQAMADAIDLTLFGLRY